MLGFATFSALEAALADRMRPAGHISCRPVFMPMNQSQKVHLASMNFFPLPQI